MESAPQACRADLEVAERKIWRDAIQLYNRDKTQKQQIVVGQAQADLPADAFENAGKLIDAAEQRCTKRYKTESQSTRRQAISSILQELRQYAPILDVFTQGAPYAVSVCWGVARVVLEATTRGLQFGPDLLDNICRILRQVSTFRRQLVYIASNNQSSTSVTHLYAALIDYLVKVCRHCQAHFWRRKMQASGNKLTFVYDKIFQFAKEVESQIAADSSVAIAEFKAAQQDHNRLSLRLARDSKNMLGKSINSARDGLVSQQDQHNQELHIIEWLKADLIQDRTLPTFENGTCAWISCHPAYCKWMEAGCSKSLWICGPSSSGKTSLSLALASRATSSGQNVVLASVLQVANFNQCPAANLIVSIIVKIVLHPSLLNGASRRRILEQLATRQSFGLRSAVSSPTDTLATALKAVLDLVPPLVLIVDGLDQLATSAPSQARATAPEVATLLNQISHITPVSLVVLSRAKSWISTRMDNAILLNLTEDITNSDIEIAIQHKARRSPRLQCLEGEIIRIARLNASGDFMYAILLIDELEGARSLSDQKSILAAAPPTTEATYHDLCKKKVDTLCLRDRERRAHIFLMVIGSKVPLTQAEVDDGMALDLVNNNELKEERLFDPQNDIPDLGDPFIVLSNTRVHFRHDSARKYVLKYLVSLQDANTFLLNICLTKLIEDKYQSLDYCAKLLKNDLLTQNACQPSSMATVAEGSGLYDHATRHWHEYAIQLQVLPPGLWEKLRVFLHGNSFVAWSENLYTVRNRTGLDGHLEVAVAIMRWYKSLPEGSKPDIVVDQFFIQPYEDISEELGKRSKEPELQYLPLIRIAGYLNNGGRTTADFEKSLKFARKVVDGFTEYLGERDPNTLNARLAYYQGILALRRPDEALTGYLDVLRIQQEDFDKETIDIYRTWQWVGNCYRFLTKFAESRTALETALDGFKRIYGERNKYVLFVALGLADTVDAQGNVDEAATSFSRIYNDWVSVNGSSNLFAANIMAGYGSALRKQGHYRQAEEVLFEAFATRVRLLTLNNDTTVDSGLHLAVLYRQQGQREAALAFLNEIKDSLSLEASFERMCEREHIKGLLAFDGGAYEGPRNALTRLVMMSTGDTRERNNRELLWVRLNIADAARDHDDEESVPSLFTELVVPIDPTTSRTSPCQTPTSSADDMIMLDTPKQLKLAEQALRLTRNNRSDEAVQLLMSENLKWARDKDFWILGGGPKVDTDSVRYHIPPRLVGESPPLQRRSEADDPIVKLRKLVADLTGD